MNNLLEYKEFLNELKLVQYTNIENIESVYFVVYKENLYLFDFGSDDYIKKTQNFIDFLKNEGFKHINIEVDTFDDANTFFENYLSHPKIISGNFHLNKFNKNVPDDVVIAVFFENEFFEIKISDVIKKIMNILPGLEYFEINKDVYHKDDIIKKYGMGFNRRSKLPEVVYHGTSSQFIKQILKNGIQPKKDNTIFQVKHEKYIFLSTSFQTAKRYSTFSVARDFNLKTKKIVLEIQTDRLDRDKIIFDYDFYHKFVGKGNNLYDKMRSDILKKDNDNDFIFAHLSNKNMGGLFKKFGYSGIVLPTKINKIYINLSTSTTTNFDWKEFTVPEFKDYMKENEMS